MIDLFAIEAGGRLVKQQQLRLGCERTRQFHALAVSERQVADHAVGDLLQVHKVDQFAGAAAKEFLLAGHDRGRQRVRDKAAAGPAMTAKHDVLEHRERAEQGEILEGAADAETGHAVRGRAGQTVTVEDDFAVPRAVELG